MRVRGLENLAKALSERARSAPVPPETPAEPVRTALPVPYRGRGRRICALSAAETRESRIYFLTEAGKRHYGETGSRKAPEGDPGKVYTGPRFVPPTPKPVPGRGY